MGWRSDEAAQEAGVDMVVAGDGVPLPGPLARFDDELAIAVSLAHLETTSMVAAITVDRDAIRVAEGKTRHG